MWRAWPTPAASGSLPSTKPSSQTGTPSFPSATMTISRMISWGDFYAEYCKIYQKWPIYWLFDSGKKNGFKCLIYLHRYQPDTIAHIRTDYVHE